MWFGCIPIVNRGLFYIHVGVNDEMLLGRGESAKDVFYISFRAFVFSVP